MCVALGVLRSRTVAATEHGSAGSRRAHHPPSPGCVQDHTHTFINKDGDVRELDFRFFLGDQKIGAPFHGEE